MKSTFNTIINRKLCSIKFKTNTEELVGFVSGTCKIKGTALGTAKCDWIYDEDRTTLYVGVNMKGQKITFDFETYFYTMIGGSSNKCSGKFVKSSNVDFKDISSDDPKVFQKALVQLVTSYYVFIDKEMEVGWNANL